jgi:hypothetical protein
LIIERFLIDDIIGKKILPLLVARPTGIAKTFACWSGDQQGL